MTDIVVVGRREKQSDGSYLLHLSTETGVPGIRFVAPREVSEDGGSVDPELEVAVKIEKTLAATDQAKMEDAARKLIKAVVTVITALEAADPTALIAVLGRTVTIGALLLTLENTQFVITDRATSNSQNNGVGSARRGTDGEPNVDTINYEAIVGSSTSTGYADPGFLENSGMHALVLHEAAHLTQAGNDFFERSKLVALADTTDSADFYQTEYASNVEAFANAIMTDTSAKIGIDLHGIQPGTAAAPVTPESIYQAHNGHPFTG